MSNGEYQLQGLGDVQWGVFTHFARTGLIRHGFSTRHGGISQVPFASLNLGLHTGDSAASVQENRRRYCAALGLDVRRAVAAEQVHGESIAVITERDCGRGALVYSSAIPQTDALITNVAGIPLLMFYADCVPVYFLDPEHKVIAVAHAGWKGTVAKIGQKTLRMMTKEFATNPASCLVAIGPSIGPCCYEVDQFVYDKVKTAFADADELLRETGKGRWKFDLWAANRRQLEEIGILRQNIIGAEICTACNAELYFSYRAEQGTTGRMGALMALI